MVSSMIGPLQLVFLAGCASAKLHHLYVGMKAGSMIHALEINDEARTVVEMGMIPAVGSSPSLAVDVCIPSLRLAIAG